MVTASMFRKTWESLPSQSFSHRKVRGDGKVIDRVEIPTVVLEAVKSASRIETVGESRAKARFERLMLETVIPGASQGMTDKQVTAIVSHVGDVLFPKDEDKGEFKTHPISREVPPGTKSPSAYFWKEGDLVPESGVRCAPRPFRGESVDVEKLSPEDLLGKANSEERGRLLRGEISAPEMVEAVKTRLSKKTAPRVDEEAIAKMVAEGVRAQLIQLGLIPAAE